MIKGTGKHMSEVEEWTKSYADILSSVSELECEQMAVTLRIMGFEEEKQVGMIMVSVKDCFDVPFYLGEALVSESIASYRNSIGYGMLLGNKQNSAFIIACADAARRAGDPGSMEFISEFIRRRENALKERIEEEKAMVKSTKVNFGLMVEG